MNLLHLGRSAVWVGLTFLVAITSTGATAALTACGETASCARLRKDTYAAKEIWDSCDPLAAHPCVIEPGNPKDCTGVLSCDFAVNPQYRAEAELATYRMGEQSQGCYLCAIPNCIAGAIAYCEPVSRRCVVVTQLLDGGGTSTVTVPPSNDAGVTVSPTPDASTVIDGADGSPGLLPATL